MSTGRRLWALALVLGLASAGMAMETPEGTVTNAERGHFGENRYFFIEKAIAQTWLANQPGQESGLVGVVLGAKEPLPGPGAEKIEIAFMVMDPKFEKQCSPILGGGVRAAGALMFKWNFLDPEGRPVPDGSYRIVMNITGEKHGDLLKGAVFPVYLCSRAPVVSAPEQSADRAVLEFDAAPEIRFTSNVPALARVAEYNQDNEEISRWEGPLDAGRHTLRSDLRDRAQVPFKPGRYTTRVSLWNRLGESDTLEYAFDVGLPPPLALSVDWNGPDAVQVDTETEIPYTIATNQNVLLTVEHVGPDGRADYIGQSASDQPATPLSKGRHAMVWHRVNTNEFVLYNTGAHKIRVTATTLAGESKTVETGPLTLSPAPPPPPPKVSSSGPGSKPRPRRTVPKLKLELDPDQVLIGGRMVTRIHYAFDQDSMIKLTLLNKRGRVVKRLVNSGSDHVKKGSYSIRLDAEDFDYGVYKVVFTATNFYGTRTTSKEFSVTWR